MDIVVCSYSGILLSNKKEQTADIYNNMDGSQNIILGERNLTQRSTYCTIPFI